MTDMKRVTIALPEEVDKMIVDMRKEDQFVRCSYSEIVRYLLDVGIKKRPKSK